MPMELRNRTARKPPPVPAETASVSSKASSRKPRTVKKTSKRGKMNKCPTSTSSHTSGAASSISVSDEPWEEEEDGKENLRKHYGAVAQVFSALLHPPGHTEWRSGMQNFKEELARKIAIAKKADVIHRDDPQALLCKTPLGKKVFGLGLRDAQGTSKAATIPEPVDDVFELSAMDISIASSASTQYSKSKPKKDTQKQKKRVSVKASVLTSPWGRVTRAKARRIAGSNASSVQSSKPSRSKKGKSNSKKTSEEQHGVATDSAPSTNSTCEEEPIPEEPLPKQKTKPKRKADGRKRKIDCENGTSNAIDTVPETFDFEDLKSSNNAVKKRRMERPKNPTSRTNLPKASAAKSDVPATTTPKSVCSTSRKIPMESAEIDEQLRRAVEDKLKLQPVVLLSRVPKDQLPGVRLCPELNSNISAEVPQNEQVRSEEAQMLLPHAQTKTSGSKVSPIQVAHEPMEHDIVETQVEAVEDMYAEKARIEVPLLSTTPSGGRALNKSNESPNVLFESSIVATPDHDISVPTVINAVKGLSIANTSKQHAENIGRTANNETFVKRSEPVPIDSGPSFNATYRCVPQTSASSQIGLGSAVIGNPSAETEAATALTAGDVTFAVPSKFDSVSNHTKNRVMDATYALDSPSNGNRSPGPGPRRSPRVPSALLGTTFAVAKKPSYMSKVDVVSHVDAAKKHSQSSSGTPRKDFASPSHHGVPKHFDFGAGARTKVSSSTSSTGSQETLKSFGGASARGSGVSVNSQSSKKDAKPANFKNPAAAYLSEKKKQEEELNRLQERQDEGVRKREQIIQQKKDNQRKKNEEWKAKIEKKKAEDALRAQAEKAKLESRGEDHNKGYVHKVASGFAKPMLPPIYHNTLPKPIPKNAALPKHLKNTTEITSSCPDIAGASAKPVPAGGQTMFQKVFGSAGNLLTGKMFGIGAHTANQQASVAKPASPARRHFTDMGPPASPARPIVPQVVYDLDSSSSGEESYATADTTMNSVHNLSTYDITMYEDIDEDQTHRANKRIPDWAKNDNQLGLNLFLQQPDLLDRLHSQIFPPKNIGFKLFPSNPRDGL